jgi:DNA-binding PadR family transcriptional regulator
MHGYEVIQELEKRTDGLWRPSPGSVYPTLQLLEDQGHVAAEEDGGKRRFSLTETGRALAEEGTADRTPWEEFTAGVGPDTLRLRRLMGQLGAAVFQVAQAGSRDQQAEAEELLTATRRRLYGILAEES